MCQITMSTHPTTCTPSEYPQNWLPKSGTVLVAGFLGWTIPSSIPVSGFGGASLFSKFTEEIGIHLAQFPQGPPLDDSFWIYMITWHLYVVVVCACSSTDHYQQGPVCDPHPWADRRAGPQVWPVLSVGDGNGLRRLSQT